MDIKNTAEWNEYQSGLNYKRKINLQPEVDKNERFYAGKQWEGVKSNGLPTPVFNIIKRVIQYKIAAIMSNQVKMQYSIEGIDDETDDEKSLALKEVAKLLSDYSQTMWERLKQDKLNEEGLKDGALSGDILSYHFWDDSIDTGQEAKGDVNEEGIDNVNYIPGNPNDNRVQPQPYIIIPFRRLVANVKKEAKANGIPQEEIDKITADNETENQSGDMAKIELDDSKKAICLLKLWKNPDTGTIWAKKSTHSVVYRKEYDTELKRYPVALMNWELRKNSCHGVPEASGLIPNQIFINKAFANAMINVMLTAFPKLVYDKSKIDKPTNAIGEALGVDQGNVRDAAAFLTPGQASVDVYKMIDMTIQYTKEMMGANEAALGEVDPKNTSAIIAIQKASSVPLESVKRRFYQYVEDIGMIWLDFWLSKYGKRNLTITKNGVTKVIPFDGEMLKDITFRLKIDVGPSTQWSEITALQTLDSLLDREKITFEEYLERLPNGIIPMKQELLDKIKQEEQSKANMLPTAPPDKMSVTLKQNINGITEYDITATSPDELLTIIQTLNKAIQPMAGQVPGQDVAGQVPNQGIPNQVPTDMQGQGVTPQDIPNQIQGQGIPPGMPMNPNEQTQMMGGGTNG